MPRFGRWSRRLAALALLATGCRARTPPDPTGPTATPGEWVMLGPETATRYFRAVHARTLDNRIDFRIETAPEFYWTLAGLNSDEFIVFLDVDQRIATGCSGLCHGHLIGLDSGPPTPVDIGADFLVALSHDAEGLFAWSDDTRSFPWNGEQRLDYLKVSSRERFLEFGIARDKLENPRSVSLIVYFFNFFNTAKRFPAAGHLVYTIPRS